jgi:hypothetical protein
MRGLFSLALLISLFAGVCPCNGAVKTPAGGQAPPAADPASAAAADPATPITGPIDQTILECYKLASGESPCCCPKMPHCPNCPPKHAKMHHPCMQKPSLAARLSAIDSIGGSNSAVAVIYLRGLLKEQCCGCANVETILVALHVVEALGKLGPKAASALPELDCAAGISSDLAVAIYNAKKAIQKQPKHTSKVKQKTQPAASTAPSGLDEVATALMAVEKSVGAIHKHAAWNAAETGKLECALKDLAIAIKAIKCSSPAETP